MVNRIVCLIALPFLLFLGCSMPNSSVKTGELRPGIGVQGAPKDSVLWVDGLSMGKVEKYDTTPTYLFLESGTHLIVIKTADDKEIYHQKIFIDSGLKVIKVY